MFRLLLVSLAAVLLVSNRISAQGYTFLRIVDERTPRPDGPGTFFPVSPAIDGNVVVFNQGAFCASCPSPDSIWAANLDTGALTKLVDTSATPPGSTARYDRFESGVFLRRGVVVFLAIDANSKPGLYAVSANGGAVTRLADTTLAVPGGNGNFSSFNRGEFSHDGATVVFSASGGGTNGVYSVKIDGTGLARVADGNTHSQDNKPVLLAGQLGGAFKTGQHIEFPTGAMGKFKVCNEFSRAGCMQAQIADLYLTFLQAFGIAATTFAGTGAAPFTNLGG